MDLSIHRFGRQDTLGTTAFSPAAFSTAPAGTPRPSAPCEDSRVVGILVHGDNHLIVRGPCPDRETALALIRHWSIIRIGQTTPETLRPWRISTREFREDLEWAIVVPGDGQASPAVAQLLAELRARGVHVRDTDAW